MSPFPNVPLESRQQGVPGGNAYQKDGSFTFYDFDYCGWGCRAYDLAAFPWSFAIRERTTERIEARGRAFLKGYMHRRRLGAIDIHAVPAFLAIRQIWLMGLQIGVVDRFARRVFRGKLNSSASRLATP